MELRMEPIKAARSTSGAAGTTSATGFPWRVIRMGDLVFLDLFEDGKAFGFEFGDGDLLH